MWAAVAHYLNSYPASHICTPYLSHKCHTTHQTYLSSVQTCCCWNCHNLLTSEALICHRNWNFLSVICLTVTSSLHILFTFYISKLKKHLIFAYCLHHGKVQVLSFRLLPQNYTDFSSNFSPLANGQSCSEQMCNSGCSQCCDDSWMLGTTLAKLPFSPCQDQTYEFCCLNSLVPYYQLSAESMKAVFSLSSYIFTVGL